MKRNMVILGRMLTVYILLVATVAGVLLVSVLLSSLVAWNTNLFNMDNGLTILALSGFLGFAIATWMLIHDWDGFINMCDRERD